ncbi:MAG: nucleotide exchange factor GrpE [Chthoniobacterales bacterium]
MTDQAENAAAENAEPELQAVRDDFEKFKDLYLRAQADLDNYRKRAARETEDARRYANLSLLERLLPVLDNFELGLDAARQSGGAENILQGMSMVQKQLQDFLRDSGVEAIEAVGQPFDPNLHEALGQEPSDEVPEGIVTRQMRRGYKLKDRLLRPSAVMVSKGAAAE